jgi:hypothetical protein
MENVEIRRHALNLLKLSKKFFLEDGDLDPTAFIFTAEEQLLRPIELHDEASKIESCTKIIDEARRQNALAIVTVFLARSKNFDKGDFDQEDYSWGDTQQSNSDRNILLTLSGPGIKNWAVALPFKMVNGKVVFRKRVEFKRGVDLGLFPGWSEQITSPRVS